MAWIKALHLIFMVTWMSGLFYLPRLFVYHAMCQDEPGNARFKVMERKLFYAITTPGAVLTIFFGLWLFTFNSATYLHLLWFQIKLACVGVLVIYHLYLGTLMRDFRLEKNHHSHKFYRWLNEVPTVLMFFIIILAVVKPAF